MTNEVPAKNRRFWSWAQFGIALSLIPVGLVCWFLGLAVGLGAGSSGDTSDDWLVPIVEWFFVAWPLIVGIGVFWLLVIVIRHFLA
jgi:hypothetical protein